MQSAGIDADMQDAQTPNSIDDGIGSSYTVGVLAYGSLIDDPGPEIGPKIQLSLLNVETPFAVEYARSSRSRGGAPTLVPVDTGGSHVSAVIHVLEDNVSVEQAMDWVWRREVRRYGKDHYRPSPKPGRDTVVVDSVSRLRGVGTVLFTRIAANIWPLNAEELAKRAIESAKILEGKSGRDGISYLINAIARGIRTPLTDAYKNAVLAITNSPDLVAAVEYVRGSNAPRAKNNARSIVLSFCQECVWARSMRTHFAHLYERGEKRHRLLAEVANTFFHDLNLALMEYVLLQQCKLTDPASSGLRKDNLTTNYLIGLPWTAETRTRLASENDELMRFREKIDVARRRLVAHTDVRARAAEMVLGAFSQADELAFWAALQRFVTIAHEEAVGGPFEIEASMPDGDADALIQRLVDAIDYDDLTKENQGLLLKRIRRRRYDDV
jgi:hypothetical protein